MWLGHSANIPRLYAFTISVPLPMLHQPPDKHSIVFPQNGESTSPLSRIHKGPPYKHLGAAPIQLPFLCPEILAQTQFSVSLAHLDYSLCCLLPKGQRVISYILSSFFVVYGRKASLEQVTLSYLDVKVLMNILTSKTTKTSPWTQSRMKLYCNPNNIRVRITSHSFIHPSVHPAYQPTNTKCPHVPGKMLT